MKLYLALLLVGVGLSEPGTAWAENYWNLPQVLNAENTEIKFSLDTTWHTLEGQVRVVGGEVRLTDPRDYKAVGAVIHIPVTAMDTGNKSRDKEMRQVMSAETFPEISFVLSNLGSEICNPSAMATEEPCSFHATGELKIRDITKNLPVSASVIKTRGQDYVVSGTTKLDWSEFGVEDPSILVARVHKDVTINFKMQLKHG